MAKIKFYQFKDGNTYTANKKLIAALGESPHIRQVGIVVAATSKRSALEFLNAVGFGINALESHLVLSDAQRYKQLQDEGTITEGTVIVSPLLARTGTESVLLTPTDNRHDPEITNMTAV